MTMLCVEKSEEAIRLMIVVYLEDRVIERWGDEDKMNE